MKYLYLSSFKILTFGPKILPQKTVLKTPLSDAKLGFLKQILWSKKWGSKSRSWRGIGILFIFFVSLCNASQTSRHAGAQAPTKNDVAITKRPSHQDKQQSIFITLWERIGNIFKKKEVDHKNSVQPIEHKKEDATTKGLHKQATHNQAFSIQKPIEETTKRQDSQVEHKKSTTLPIPVIDSNNLDQIPIDFQSIKIFPNIKSKTFRFELKTNANLNMVIIKHSLGVYVVFDQPLSAALIDLPGMKYIVDSIDIVPNAQNLILKLNCGPFVTVRLEQENSINFLTFYHEEKISLSDAQAQTPSIVSVDAQWPQYAVQKISPGIEKKINIEGIEYYVYMTNTPDGGCQKSYMTPYFESVITNQGFALKNYSAKTTYQYSGKENKLVITPHLEDQNKSDYKEEGVFCNIFDVDQKLDIRDKYLKLNHALLKIQGPLPFDLSLKTVLYALELVLIPEAIGILNQLQKTYPLADYNPLFCALSAMTYFLRRDNYMALQYWKKIPPNHEMMVWQKIAEAELGRTEGIQNHLKNAMTLVASYGQLLREALIQRIIPLVHFTDTIQIEDLISRVNWGGSFYMKSFLSIHNARSFVDRKNYHVAGQIISNLDFKSFKEQPNIEFITYAQYILAVIEMQQKFLSTPDTIKKFETIRYYWRSDSLEYKILSIILMLHESEKDIINVLKTLQQIKKLYPLRAMLDVVDRRIQISLYDYIINSNHNKPLKVIDTFSEFSEYLLPGPEGLEITQIVSQQFEKVGLLDDAAEILNRSLRTMPDDEQKMNRIMQIANLYERNKKYEAEIALLDTLPEASIPPQLKTKVQIEKAKAYNALGKKKQAIALLEKSTDPQHILLQSSILFDMQDWKKVIATLETIIEQLDQHKKDEQAVLKESLFQLAFALVMDGQPEKDPKDDLKNAHSSKAKLPLTHQEKKDKVVDNPHVASGAEKNPKAQMQITESLLHSVRSAFLKEPSPELLAALKDMQHKAHKNQDKLDKLREKYKTFMHDNPVFLLLTRERFMEITSLNAAEHILKDVDKLIELSKKA